MSIQTRDEVLRVLGQITFAPSCVDMNWSWEVSRYCAEMGGWLVRTTFQRPDTDTEEIGTGYGRYWFVAKGDSPSGFVKTAWLACKQIIEHELMEAFLYQSVRVFDPHADVIDLIDLNRRRRPRTGPPEKTSPPEKATTTIWLLKDVVFRTHPMDVLVRRAVVGTNTAVEAYIDHKEWAAADVVIDGAMYRALVPPASFSYHPPKSAGGDAQ